MRRVLGFAVLLALAGCGSGMIMTTPEESMDMAMPVLDLTVPITSGPGDQTCGASTCLGNCTVCVQFAGGLCAIPCSTSNPSTCSTGICNAATSSGDAGAGAIFHGDCSAYNGFCG